MHIWVQTLERWSQHKIESMAINKTPWKSIWKPSPTKSGVLRLDCSYGKSFNNRQLEKRRILMVDWWCKCKMSGKTVDHLFLHCSITIELWSIVLNDWDLVGYA